MKKEEKYYYLSVPDKVDWTKIKVLESEVATYQNWDDCIKISANDTLGLYAFNSLAEELKDLVSAYFKLIVSDFGTASTSNPVWWVNVSEESKVMKIGLGNGMTSNPTDCNYFQDESQADGLRKVIRTVFMKYGIKTENK